MEQNERLFGGTEMSRLFNSNFGAEMRSGVEVFLKNILLQIWFFLRSKNYCGRFYIPHMHLIHYITEYSHFKISFSFLCVMVAFLTSCSSYCYLVGCHYQHRHRQEVFPNP